MRAVDNSYFTSGAILSLSPSSVLLGWGEIDLNPGVGSPIWCFPDFFLKDTRSRFSFSNYTLMNPKELLNALEQPTSLNSLQWSDPDWEGLTDRFVQLKRLIALGELIKAVPYVEIRAQAEMNPQRRRSALIRCLEYQQRYPKTFLYGYWSAQEGLMGVTPERLFQLDQKKLHTMACAGTASQADTFLYSQKLQLEHQIVVDAIENSLTPFGRLKKENSVPTYVGAFAHWVTNIYLESDRQLDPFELVSLLHPTPALGAWPRIRGLKWLEDYNRYIARGRYGAPVGVILNNDFAIFHVAIRGMQWNERSVTIKAGVGVVADSVFEEEKEELMLKLTHIERVFQT